MEMKLFLIEIIKTFHIQLSENNKQETHLKEELTISPDHMWIKLIKRNS